MQSKPPPSLVEMLIIFTICAALLAGFWWSIVDLDERAAQVRFSFDSTLCPLGFRDKWALAPEPMC